MNKKNKSAHEDVRAAVALQQLASLNINKFKQLGKSKEPSLQESFRESFENPTFILSSIVVGVCALRFLIDGLAVTIMGQTLIAPHTDPMAYGSILTPVLAAHSYIKAKGKNKPTESIKNENS